MEMKRSLFESLKTFDLAIRDDYSGRGMFGAQCFALDTDNLATSVAWLTNALVEFIQNASAEEQDAVDCATELLEQNAFANPKVDSMGLGYIVYFPNITVEGETDG